MNSTHTLLPSERPSVLRWLPNRLRPAAWWLVAIGAVAVALLSFEWSRQYLHNVCDDTLISLQYARNLAAGRGLVFNPGEYVEGYTNFLWVVWLAALTPLESLGFEFVRVAAFLSILLAAVDVVLVGAIGKLLWGRRWLPVLCAVGLCVADNAYSVWAMQALESHLVIFWMLTSAWFFWGSRWRWRGVAAGVSLAALVMSRPDAALFVFAIAGSELLAVVEGRRTRNNGAAGPPRLDARVADWRVFATALGVSAIAYGAYFLWRYDYFGYLLPNTFYLKAGGLRIDAVGRGSDYWVDFLRVHAWVPLLAPLSVFWIRDRIVRALLAWCILHVAYVIYVGGDFYPGHRFFVVLTPVLALLTGRVIAGVEDASGWCARRLKLKSPGWRPAGLVLVGTGVIAMVGVVAVRGLRLGPSQTEIARWASKVDSDRRFMEWIGERAPVGATMVAGDIGTSGYYGGVHVYDFYGVIDPEVAHRDVTRFGLGKAGHEKRADRATLFAKQPTYVKAGYLGDNLYARGYYFETELPANVRDDGIWVRDELPETGSWLPGSHLPFAAKYDPGWEASGSAFELGPTRRPGEHQQPVVGAAGWWISSYHPSQGDAATGTLRSAPIAIEGDLMVLRVAGGDDPVKLSVSLVVDGERVATATGSVTEHFGRRVWDVRAYRGKMGTLEIVDSATGPWGHIMVDEIRQWRAGRSAVGARTPGAAQKRVVSGDPDDA